MLTDDLATVAKNLLWAGKSQAHVAALLGVSQPTISRIKSGSTFEHVPWPNGDTGPMPFRLPEEASWTELAQRYLSYPQALQDRILEIVNARRAETGTPPIPAQAEEYTRFLNADPLDKEFEAITLLEAREAEDRRCSTIIREFEEIAAEEFDEKRARATQDILISTRDGGRRSPPPERSSARLGYTKMDWGEVKEKGAGVPIVQEALLGDACLREAVCIVFEQLKGSTKNWRLPVTREQILDVAEVLRKDDEVVRKLEEEYRGIDDT